MNRIYNKVWNKELGQLVVASELASSDSVGASGASRAPGVVRGALALAILLALVGLPGKAMAADAFCVDTAGNLIGTASSAGHDVACGQDAEASGGNAIAIGYQAKATTGTNPLAIGTKALASTDSAVAVGDDARATGLTSTAIG